MANVNSVGFPLLVALIKIILVWLGFYFSGRLIFRMQQRTLLFICLLVLWAIVVFLISLPLLTIIILALLCYIPLNMTWRWQVLLTLPFAVWLLLNAANSSANLLREERGLPEVGYRMEELAPKNFTGKLLHYALWNSSQVVENMLAKIWPLKRVEKSKVKTRDHPRQPENQVERKEIGDKAEALPEGLAKTEPRKDKYWPYPPPPIADSEAKEPLALPYDAPPLTFSGSQEFVIDGKTIKLPIPDDKGFVSVNDKSGKAIQDFEKTNINNNELCGIAMTVLSSASKSSDIDTYFRKTNQEFIEPYYLDIMYPLNEISHNKEHDIYRYILKRSIPKIIMNESKLFIFTVDTHDVYYNKKIRMDMIWRYMNVNVKLNDVVIVLQLNARCLECSNKWLVDTAMSWAKTVLDNN